MCGLHIDLKRLKEELPCTLGSLQMLPSARNMAFRALIVLLTGLRGVSRNL